jgi:AcrR family transcriptional regulator
LDKGVKRLSRQERREEIVRTAKNLFARRGFNGTTTRDIARAAGVSEALIFKFFPDKNALYSAIVESKLQQVSQASDMGFFTHRQGESDRDLFTRIAATYIYNLEKDDSFMRILFFSTLEGHRLTEMYIQKRISEVIRELAGTIHRGTAQGRYRKTDPVIAARIFIGMIYDYLILKRIFKVKKPPLHGRKQTVEAIVDIFLGGIEVRARAGARAGK